MSSLPSFSWLIMVLFGTLPLLAVHCVAILLLLRRPAAENGWVRWALAGYVLLLLYTMAWPIIGLVMMAVMGGIGAYSEELSNGLSFFSGVLQAGGMALLLVALLKDRVPRPGAGPVEVD